MVKEEKKTAKPRTKKVKKATEHKEAHHEKHEHKVPPHEVKHEHKEAHHEKHEPKEIHHEKVPETKKVTKSKKKKPPKKPQRKVFVTRGKRKESVARATISEGKGVIRINSQNIDSINNHYIKEIIREPMRYVGPEANNIDIAVNVNGGGVMGQAQAARTAIANALVAYFDGMNLKEKFISIDRSLIIDDTRRVETKKFRGPKARARFQKSYR